MEEEIQWDDFCELYTDETQRYYRDRPVLFSFVFLFFLMLYFIAVSKKKINQFLFFVLSLIVTLPIGQSVRMNEFQIFEDYGFFITLQEGRLRNYPKYNSELMRNDLEYNSELIQLNRTELLYRKMDDPKFEPTKEQLLKYHCISNYGNHDWITYQYGMGDSCIKVYNKYPDFLKLKNQAPWLKNK